MNITTAKGRLPLATTALAVVYAGTLAYSLLVSDLRWERAVYAYGARPYELRHLSDLRPTIPLPDWTPALSAWLLNDGWPPVIATFICLVLFAPAVERAVGPLRFLGIYAAAGILAVVQLVALRADATTPTVGAVAPVFACVGACLVLAPARRLTGALCLGAYVSLLGLQYFDVIGTLGAVTVQTTGDTLLAAASGLVVGLIGAAFAGSARRPARVATVQAA